MARDITLDRVVALKMPHKSNLSPLEAESFLREVRATAQLHHPNIVRMQEMGVGDRIFMVSDLVSGPTLSQRLLEHPLSDVQAARLCATLADALQHAHEAGVVHRDLKPAHVLIDAQGAPHLIGFGLAKARDVREFSGDRQVLGTPAYMSPEQAAGDYARVDGRSDVYSLGVILYELLTGRRPFSGEPVMMLMRQSPPPPRKIKKTIPRDLEAICLKALEKDLARRYQTAKDMGDDLRRFLEGKPSIARNASFIERAWRRWRPARRDRLPHHGTLAPEILSDWRWALRARDAGELREHSGKFVGIVNQTCVDAGEDPATVRAAVAEQCNVSQERVLVLFVEEDLDF
jgi:serine/threonine-protein kinase